MQYNKYRVKNGQIFRGVGIIAKEGEHVFFPAAENVSAFFDKIELVGPAKPAEVVERKVTPEELPGIVPPPENKTDEPLEAKSITQLKKLAKSEGVPGYTKMDKDELIVALEGDADEDDEGDDE